MNWVSCEQSLPLQRACSDPLPLTSSQIQQSRPTVAFTLAIPGLQSRPVLNLIQDSDTGFQFSDWKVGQLGIATSDAMTISRLPQLRETSRAQGWERAEDERRGKACSQLANPEMDVCPNQVQVHGRTDRPNIFKLEMMNCVLKCSASMVREEGAPIHHITRSA